MALNTTLVEFHIQRIANANIHTFDSEVKQLFEHLNSEIKDNKTFERYNHHSSDWTSWINHAIRSNWQVPNNNEDYKYLAFAIYKFISMQPSNGYQYTAPFGRGLDVEDNIRKFNGIFLEYLIHACNEIIAGNPEHEQPTPQPISGDTVFVIHGHNEEMLTDLNLLLFQSGVKHIVLKQIPDKNRNLIDKLIEESKTASYAIAIVSPDDYGIQARQNVILEIGYFISQLGKSRVRMLVKDGVILPTDLHGILYEKYNEDGKWRTKLIKELIAAGIGADIMAVV